MSLTVQSILDSSASDLRQVLSSSSDTSISIPWVDRIHKDVLHTSLFNNISQTSTTQATSAGTGTYTLGPTDIRRILLVYDRTFNRTLRPMDLLDEPAPLGEQVSLDKGMQPGVVQPKNALSALTQQLFPEYYRFVGTQTFLIFPAPATATWAGTLEIYYEKQVASLTSTGDTLLIPEDGKDVVVAGVNFLAATYLKMPEEAAVWRDVYERGKRGELIV